MRFIIVLLSLFLVSCATPKVAPNAYYSGTFLPGTASIGDDGLFVSSASTFDEDAVSLARKAAFSRLLKAAEDGGYSYFSIDSEKTGKVLGHRFTVRGSLYKTAQAGEGVFPVSAIKRLLKGLTLVAPKPVYRAPKPKIKTAAAPSDEPLGEEPLVIMAPTDITGSIKKSDTMENSAISVEPAPHAVGSIPTGVILVTK